MDDQRPKRIAMNIVAAPHSFVRLKVAPSTPGIGAEISGINLACEQDDATIAEIRAALLAYKVVFFRSEEHTSELQSLMRNSYAVFCLKKKDKTHENNNRQH